MQHHAIPVPVENAPSLHTVVCSPMSAANCIVLLIVSSCGFLTDAVQYLVLRSRSPIFA